MEKPYRMIITMVMYGRVEFSLEQKEYSFSSKEQLDKAKKHFLSEEFTRNIEASGCFVKVDVHTV